MACLCANVLSTLYVVDVLACWCSRVLAVLHKMACLLWFIKWPA